MTHIFSYAKFLIRSCFLKQRLGHPDVKNIGLPRERKKTVNVRPRTFQNNLEMKSPAFRLVWGLLKTIMLQNIEIIPQPPSNYFTSTATKTF